MADFWQTTILNAFYWTKIYEFRMRFRTMTTHHVPVHEHDEAFIVDTVN